MSTENEYLSDFEEIAEEKKLKHELKVLSNYEKIQMFSGIIQIPHARFIDVAEVIRLGEKVFLVDPQRKEFGDRFIATVKESLPKDLNFSSVEQTIKAEVFLHAVNPEYVVSLNDEAKQQFSDLRHRVRLARTALKNGMSPTVASPGLSEQVTQELLNEDKHMSRLRDERKEVAQGLEQQTKRHIENLRGTPGADLKKLGVALIEGGEALTVLIKDEKLRDDVNYALAALKGTIAEEKLPDKFTNGACFIGAVGQMTNNKTLQEIAEIGKAGIQIGVAIQQLMEATDKQSAIAGGELLAKTSITAIINPIAAIGVLLTGLLSFFFRRSTTPGPNPHELILKQLNRIEGRLLELHKLIEENFRDIHFQVKSMEEKILRAFQQLRHSVTKSVLSKLEEIHSDLNYLSRYTQLAFKDVFLRDLELCVMTVDSIKMNVMSHRVLTTPKVIKMLILLSSWLQGKSYNHHFNGAMFFGDNRNGRESVLTYQQWGILLADTSDMRLLVPILFLFADKWGWLVQDNAGLPHTAIWHRALDAYLFLRAEYHTEIKENYDTENTELNQIILFAAKYSKMLGDLSTSEFLLRRLAEQIVELYLRLIKEYEDFKQASTDNFKKSALGSVANNLSASIEQTAANTIKHKIPQRFSFSYVACIPGRGKHMERQRDFSPENGFSQTQCLVHILNHANSANIPLFHPILLLAESVGFVVFNCRMHRSMVGQNQQYFTEGEKYGLEIELYITATQERILLTQATPVGDHRDWRHAHKHTTSRTIESHKNALLKRTQLLTKNIQVAIEQVKRGLLEKIGQHQLSFHQALAENALKPNSTLHQTVMCLYLLELFTRCSHYEVTDFNYRKMLRDAHGLLGVYRRLNQHAEKYIDDFFGDQLRQLNSKKEIVVVQKINMDVHIESLQDICSGLGLLNQTDEKVRHIPQQSFWSAFFGHNDKTKDRRPDDVEGKLKCKL